jgi:hypothetical protein
VIQSCKADSWLWIQYYSASPRTSEGRWRPDVTSSVCNSAVISAKPYPPYPDLLCFEMAIVPTVILLRHGGELMESLGGDKEGNGYL